MRIGKIMAVAGIAGLLVAVPATQAVASPGQTVDDLTTKTASDLVRTLTGTSLPVSGVAFTGSPLGAGTFSGFGPAIGIDQGVVLSTGPVAGDQSSILGTGTYEDASTDLGTPGDPDIAALVGDDATYDAASLEFDFVPAGDTLTLRYVFGSDEYPSWAGASFGDGVAILVNGTNCAVVDTGAGPAPVTVGTINPAANSSLYRANGSAGEVPPYDTQLNGFTVPLTCTASVRPGATNHIKLVIADVGDAGYDSAVLLEANSFAISSAPIAQGLSYSTKEGKPVAVELAATDENDRPLTYEILDRPAHGALSGSGSALTFTPEPGFVGTTAFTYRASNGIAASAPATVTITVNPNAVPVANPVSARTGKGEPVTIPLSATDADGDPLTYRIADQPGTGAVTVSGANAVFTPDAEFVGTVRFTYVASDGIAESAPATVTVEVVAGGGAGGGGGGAGNGGAGNGGAGSGGAGSGGGAGAGTTGNGGSGSGSGSTGTTSTTGAPAGKLASTGSNAPPIAAFAGLALTLGLIAFGLAAIRRRRDSAS